MEKEMKQIRFDLELAKAITNGEKKGRVVTRDGHLARIICFDVKNHPQPIIALIDNGTYEECHNFTEDGYYLQNKKINKRDIFLDVSDKQESKPKFKIKKIVLERKCPVCGKVQNLELSYEQYKAVCEAKFIDEKTVPCLTAVQREFFISGMCDYCFEELFKY